MWLWKQQFYYTATEPFFFVSAMILFLCRRLSSWHLSLLLELQLHLLQRFPRAVQDVDSRRCRCIDKHHQLALARGLITTGLRL